MQSSPQSNVHLQVRGLRRVVADSVLFMDINFDLYNGDILFVKGPSGCGKSLLLRALAYLDVLDGGGVTLNSKTPEELGVPSWRAQVMYVPQARVNHKGSPAELYFDAQRFAAQRHRTRGDLPTLVHELGLEQAVMNQAWSELSGGQAQRASLAIALALQPSVLLLDEPTSALDALSVMRVEKVLGSCGAAIVWVTHDSQQPMRVGGRIMELPLGRLGLQIQRPLPLDDGAAGTETDSETIYSS